MNYNGALFFILAEMAFPATFGILAVSNFAAFDKDYKKSSKFQLRSEIKMPENQFC